MYVYFLTAFGENPLIKIGKANDPVERMKALQTGSPFKLKMLGSVKCKSELHALQVERPAHDIFRKQRRRGEWFRLSQKHTAMIKSLIEKCASTEQSTINTADCSPNEHSAMHKA
jgi:hypothetical protein